MVSNASDPPVIGLTTYAERAQFLAWDAEATLLHRCYADCVVAAGGIPVLLPPVTTEYARLVERIDGLVLTGGADVEPGRYGQDPHPATYTRAERDVFEFGLFAAARAAGKPVLGVCRGLQVMSVALGGTLAQHLPDTLGDTTHQPAPATFGAGTVTLVDGTRAAGILGAEAKVQCYHHQAIDRLGAGLVASGHAADGTVEAAEIPGEFVLGVQWHPEQDFDDVRLFAALVNAAREGK